MTSLEALRSVFVSTVPCVDTPRCINTRHEAVDCDRCEAICPTGAISRFSVTPRISTEACVTCGACLAVCPSDAIAIPTAMENAPFRALEHLPPGDIGLVCGVHPDPQASAAPAPTVLRHGMCLASLDIGRLIALTEGGSRLVWLDTSGCSTCPIATVRSAIEQAAAAANALASLFGRPPPIATVDNGRVPAERAVVDGSHQGLTRRDLLTAAGLRREAPDTPMTRRRGAVGDRLPIALPRARRRLLDHLDRWGEAPAADSFLSTSGSPFASVVIDDDLCRGCRLCSRFCPTGALNWHSAAGSFTLGFLASLCIDCGICVAACPEDAVGLGEELAAEQLLEREWSVLLTGTLVDCAGCGQPTRGEEEANLCHSCRHGRVGPLLDQAGLMDDLISRTHSLEAK